MKVDHYHHLLVVGFHFESSEAYSSLCSSQSKHPFCVVEHGLMNYFIPGACLAISYTTFVTSFRSSSDNKGKSIFRDEDMNAHDAWSDFSACKWFQTHFCSRFSFQGRINQNFSVSSNLAASLSYTCALTQKCLTSVWYVGPFNILKYSIRPCAS